MDSYEKLNKTLVDKLNEHNESNAVMDLVLFNQAMDHVTRIHQDPDLPRGNAMLVGVGGSASNRRPDSPTLICGFEVFQISVTSSHGMADFKVDLFELYKKLAPRASR